MPPFDDTPDGPRESASTPLPSARPRLLSSVAMIGALASLGALPVSFRAEAQTAAPTTLAAPPGGASSVAGSRYIDTGRPDVRATLPRNVPVPEAPVPEPVGARPDVTVRDVVLLGRPAADVDRLVEAIRPFAGRPLTQDTLREITAAIGAVYKAQGFALYNVVIPPQDFANGVVGLQVVEGHVSEIRIDGDEDGADFSLIRAYAARVQAERPLRQTTLERALLLMNDLPGRQVTPELEPVEGASDAARLVLKVKRTDVRLGYSLDNLGAADLGRVQGNLTAAFNGLFQEGDTTRLQYAFPTDFRRFQYYALSHSQPIGTDGTTVTGSFGFLRTRPSERSRLNGTALTGSIQLSHPLIRTSEQTLQVFGRFDVLDSDTALLANQTADEATRVLRAGVSYNVTEERAGLGLNLILSQGLDAMGARQDIPLIYGDPVFSKINLLGIGVQPLFDEAVVLRLRAVLQYSSTRLPASELFTYGGVDFGRGFSPGSMTGDRAVAGSFTVALPFKTVLKGEWGDRFDRGELYGFVDGARTENEYSLLVRRFAGIGGTDRAASAGFGISVPLPFETIGSVEMARPILQPRYGTREESWRFLFSVRREL